MMGLIAGLWQQPEKNEHQLEEVAGVQGGPLVLTKSWLVNP